MSAKENSPIDWDSFQTLQKFSEITRNTCLEAFGVESCLASTRVGIDVLRHFNVPAFPLAVQLKVWNQIQMGLLIERGHFPRSEKEVQEWIREGAWAQGVGVPGYGEGPGKWPGHLVAIVHKQLLVDLSIGQASRPEKELDLINRLSVKLTKDCWQERIHSLLQTKPLLLTMNPE